MASNDRFEYSQLVHTVRIENAVTRANFCKTIRDTKAKYGLSLTVPILLNLGVQVWKPSAYTSNTWAGGNVIVFNDSINNSSDEDDMVFAVCDFITYNTTIDRWKLRLMYGTDNNFSDVGFLWVKV